MKAYGKLFLIPVPITQEDGIQQIPEYNLRIISGLNHFIVEDEKTARRFLKLSGFTDISKAELELLNEHTKKENVRELLQPLLLGHNIGLMSDAGCPGIADPGTNLVTLVHQRGMEVIPLAGPSAIVLSIMSSGFNSQNFAFVGYLPIEKTEKIKKIKELEKLAIKSKQAQFFIETPYRNEQLLEVLLTALHPQTLLFIGKNLLSKNQFIKSAVVGEWIKGIKPLLGKIPVVFGIYSR